MKYILGSDSITVFHKGTPYTINKQAHTYATVIEAVKENDEAKLEQSLNLRKAMVDSLNSKGNGVVQIVGHDIMYKDRKITGLIVSRVFDSLRLGLDVKPMLKFIENMMKNPSKRAVDELFGFMEACKLPITEDGHFLAYKRVRGDYRDVHTGTLDNSVGKVLEMERNLVDEDKNNTCSYGLHFCSYDYLKHFSGERIVVVKINPADVVAIPADYNNSKGRTCKYEVVDELPLNQYKLPVAELDEGFTNKYSEVDTPEVPDSWVQSDSFDADDFIEVVSEDDDEVKVKLPASTKLTEGEVIGIRKLHEENWSIKELADFYEISKRQVKRIINRESWKHI